jgi:hypothetical protein
MVPVVPLTEDRVWRMIKEEIEMNNVGIERRQSEILAELREIKGYSRKNWAIWGPPILITVIGLVAEIIRSSHH